MQALYKYFRGVSSDIHTNSPGIAIRILGEVTPERVAIARAADHIFISEIRAAGIYDEVNPMVHNSRLSKLTNSR